MKLSKLLSIIAVLASAAGIIYLAYKFFSERCGLLGDGVDGAEYLDAYADEFGEDEYTDIDVDIDNLEDDEFIDEVMDEEAE